MSREVTQYTEEIAEEFFINRYIYFLKLENFITDKNEVRLGTDGKWCLDENCLVREHGRSGLPIDPAQEGGARPLQKFVITRELIKPLIKKFDGKRILTNFALNEDDAEVKEKYAYYSTVRSSANVKALIPILVDTNNALKKELEALQKQKEAANKKIDDREDKIMQLKAKEAEIGTTIKHISEENELLGRALHETQEQMAEKERENKALDETLGDTREKLGTITDRGRFLEANRKALEIENKELK